MGTDMYFGIYFGSRDVNLSTGVCRNANIQQQPNVSVFHACVEVELAGPTSGSGPEAADPPDLVLVFIPGFCGVDGTSQQRSSRLHAGSAGALRQQRQICCSLRACVSSPADGASC